MLLVKLSDTLVVDAYSVRAIMLDEFSVQAAKHTLVVLADVHGKPEKEEGNRVAEFTQKIMDAIKADHAGHFVSPGADVVQMQPVGPPVEVEPAIKPIKYDEDQRQYIRGVLCSIAAYCRAGTADTVDVSVVKRMMQSIRETVASAVKELKFDDKV